MCHLGLTHTPPSIPQAKPSQLIQLHTLRSKPIITINVTTLSIPFDYCTAFYTVNYTASGLCNWPCVFFKTTQYGFEPKTFFQQNFPVPFELQAFLLTQIASIGNRTPTRNSNATPSCIFDARCKIQLTCFLLLPNLTNPFYFQMEQKKFYKSFMGN